MGKDSLGSGSPNEKGHSPWNGSPKEWKELFNGEKGHPQGVAPLGSERHFLAGRKGIPRGVVALRRRNFSVRRRGVP